MVAQLCGFHHGYCHRENGDFIMYLEENKELADGMNHLEIRLGDHGYVQVDRTWHSEQVCSPFSRLYLVRRGEGLLRVGGNSLTMRPGFAYWIPAGLCFDYLCGNAAAARRRAGSPAGPLPPAGLWGGPPAQGRDYGAHGGHGAERRAGGAGHPGLFPRRGGHHPVYPPSPVAAAVCPGAGRTAVSDAQRPGAAVPPGDGADHRAVHRRSAVFLRPGPANPFR